VHVKEARHASRAHQETRVKASTFWLGLAVIGATIAVVASWPAPSRDAPVAADVPAATVSTAVPARAPSPRAPPLAAEHDPASAAPGPSSVAVDVDPSLPQGSATSATAAVPAAGPPLRAAVDSGRAQPVFLALRGPMRARAGQRLRISVTGESENDFAQVALALEFDPGVLRVVGVRRGDLMAKRGAAAELSYGIDDARGRVAVQLAEIPGGDPLNGGGDLCTVEFMAVAPGRSPLRIADVTVTDLNGDGVGASVLAPQAVDVE